MKIFCRNLKEDVTKIINFDKKEMTPLTYKEKKFYRKQNICYR